MRIATAAKPPRNDKTFGCVKNLRHSEATKLPWESVLWTGDTDRTFVFLCAVLTGRPLPF